MEDRFDLALLVRRRRELDGIRRAETTIPQCFIGVTVLPA